MKLKTINKLCCPFDKQDLTLQVFVKDTGQNIIEAILSCAVCLRKYPIVYGVPIMSPDEYRQIKLEQPIVEQWKIDHGITDTLLLPVAEDK